MDERKYCTPNQPGHVPFYRQWALELRYEKVREYAEERKKRESISFLRRRKKEFLEMPAVESDFRLKCEASYEKHLERIARKVITLGVRGTDRLLSGPDPFARIEYSPQKFNFLPREVFEKVISIVETEMAQNESADDSRITESDRSLEIQKINEALEERRKELSELIEQSKSFFLMSEAAVTEDVRHSLVVYWRNKQSSVKEPISPLGVHLKHSFPEEKQAYEILEIAKSISPKAHKLAWPKPII